MNLQRKTRKKLVVQMVFLSFVLISIIFLSYKWFSNKTIKNVTVSGNMILDTSDIFSNIDKLSDYSNKKIKLDTITKQVNKLPYVAETHVTHKTDDEINIEVKERVPIALLFDEQGNPTYLSQDVKVLPYKIIQNYSDLPLIRNIYRGLALDTTAAAFAVDIVKTLMKEDFAKLNSSISEIIYNRQENQFYLLANSNPVKILVGNAINIEAKLNKVQAFLMEPEINMKKIKMIDIRWNNQVVVQEL